MVFRAKANKGKLDFGSLNNRDRFALFLQDNDGCNLRIEKIESKRSLSQNAYYWMYLGVIERDTGNNADDLHEYLKRKLLPPKFITVMGKEIKIPSSTKDLSKVAFGEYIDKISAETDVPLPNIEDAGYISNHGSY